MNRRGFISLLAAAAGGVVLDRAIPFGRVWSFPKNPVLANSAGQLIGTTINIRIPQRFYVRDYRELYPGLASLPITYYTKLDIEELIQADRRLSRPTAS
jgi:hypothetical protein